ncbi:MAG TPA: FecR family protein, partial [Candidatus Gracilibacteria bacterium]|nr:FecR family protein [Candidatus Gracilibacteria bacterium]
MDELEMQLRQLKNTSLPTARKQKIWALVSQEIPQDLVCESLNNLVRPSLKSYQKEQIRSKVLSALQKPIRSWWSFHLSSWYRLFAVPRYISAVLVFTLFTTGVMVWWSDALVEATAQTEIVAEKGIVKVKSLGGDWRVITEPEVLYLGDTIQTAKDSIAEIRFFDYSVTRLAENTLLNISTLALPDPDTLTRDSSLRLVKGRIWTNLTPHLRNLTIDTGAASLVAQQGVFDIQNEGLPLVRALRNMIDIKNTHGESIQLSAGFELKMEQDNFITAPISFGADAWIANNQVKDEIWENEVKEKTTEDLKVLAGLAPKGRLEPLKQIIKGNPQPSEADLLKEKIAQAKVFAFYQDQSKVSELWPLIKADITKLSTNDPAVLAEILDNEKSFFAAVDPASELYPLKKNFEALFVERAKDPLAEQLAQAKDRLLTAQSLLLDPEADKSVLVATLNDFEAINQSILAQAATSNEQIDLLNTQTADLDRLNDLS